MSDVKQQSYTGLSSKRCTDNTTNQHKQRNTKRTPREHGGNVCAYPGRSLLMAHGCIHTLATALKNQVDTDRSCLISKLTAAARIAIRICQPKPKGCCIAHEGVIGFRSAGTTYILIAVDRKEQRVTPPTIARSSSRLSYLYHQTTGDTGMNYSSSLLYAGTQPTGYTGFATTDQYFYLSRPPEFVPARGAFKPRRLLLLSTQISYRRE